MLTENKFSKYLLDAIGESVFVVIGILIALQINNWNEKNKTNSIELNTLKEVRSGYTQNSRQKDKLDFSNNLNL